MKTPSMYILTATMLILSNEARANTILVTGGEADEQRLIFLNYYAPEQAAIQDIGVPAGGLDAGSGLLDDLASIVVRSGMPSGPIGRYQWPEAFACGVGLDKPCALELKASVIAGSYLLNTGAATVFWNGEAVFTFDGTGKRCRKTQQEIRTFAIPIPPGKVRSENLLHVAPEKDGPLALIDAIRISGPSTLRTLPREKTRSLFKACGPYDGRNLSGKGQVLLVASSRHRGHDLLAKVCRALRADVTAVGLSLADLQQKRKWIDPAEWVKYRLVILDTDHEPGKLEEEAIVKYMRDGGCLMLTPFALSGLLSRSTKARTAGLLRDTDELLTSEDAADLLGCVGGFRAVNVTSSGTFTFRLKGQGSILPSWPMGREDRFSVLRPKLSLFRTTEKAKGSQVVVEASPSGKADAKYAAVFTRRIGKGSLIGWSYSRDLAVLKLCRELVCSALSGEDTR